MKHNYFDSIRIVFYDGNDGNDSYFLNEKSYDPEYIESQLMKNSSSVIYNLNVIGYHLETTYYIIDIDHINDNYLDFQWHKIFLDIFKNLHRNYMLNEIIK